MAILKDLIVSGSSRLLGKLYTNDIEIGNDLTVTGATTTTKLIVNTTVNPTKNSAVNSSTGNLAVIIGTPTGKHIAMDVDEIAAKNGVTTASALWLNCGGGAVNLSTDAKIVANNGTLTAPTISNTTLTSTTSTITTANITTANTNTINNATNIYNKNGTIETDVIKSNKWEIVSTQNLGGDFFVAPTIMVTNGSTFTISSVSGNTITGTLKDTTNITSANFGGHTWSNNSLIKITGKLTTGSTHYILGTCDGKLTAQMNNTANTINFQITCNASTVPPAGTYTITDGTVMMYNVGGSNKVGIYMTCYGTDKYTYIDIYNGSNGNTPVARLGKLDNLKDSSGNRIKVGDALTTDYGIYTKNGFFEGKVVANGGTIAGWTIGDGYITTNSNRTTYDNTSYTGMTMTASGIGARGSATSYFNLSTGGGLTAVGATVTGVITANTGYIGGTSGWTIAAQQLYSGTIGADNSLHLGTKNLGNNTSIGGRSGSDWRLTVGQHFGVTNTGAVYCNDIHAAGGTIGGFKIDTTSIRTNDVAVTSNADNSISLSSTDFTRTISGTSRAGLRFAIGDKFGVTGDGAIYASSATISGAITATSGSFTGGILLNGGYLTTNSSRTTYNSTSATGITIDKNGIGGYASSNAYFNMTTGGVLTAVGATVTGTVNATTGTFGNATNKITLGTGTSGHSSLRYGMTTLEDTAHNGFYVGTDGIALGKGAFKVTSDGTLTATSATIKGQINATSGFIGQNATNGFNITSNAIYNGISTRDATSGTGVYLGTTGINLGGGKFKVTDAGALTSTSGTIGGWTISNTSLHSENNEYGSGIVFAPGMINLSGINSDYTTNIWADTYMCQNLNDTTNYKYPENQEPDPDQGYETLLINSNGNIIPKMSFAMITSSGTITNKSDQLLRYTTAIASGNPFFELDELDGDRGYIYIMRSGYYRVETTWCGDAGLTNTSNVKCFGISLNGDTTELYGFAMGRQGSWHTVTGFQVGYIAAGTKVYLCGRNEAGSGSFRHIRVMITPMWMGSIGAWADQWF